MSDDRDAPGPAQEFLSGTATHVGDICVVDWEAKDPVREKHNSIIICVLMVVKSVTCVISPTTELVFDLKEQSDSLLLVGVCLCVSCSPLQLSAPQYVLLPVHQHRKMLVFPLFNGIGASSDGTHLPKL